MGLTDELTANLAHNIAIFCRSQPFALISFTGALNQLRLPQLYYTLRHQIIYSFLPSLIIFLPERIVFRILTNPLEQERTAKPFLGRADVSNGPKSYFRIEVFGKVRVEAALQDGFALNQSLVLLFKISFTENDRHTIFILTIISIWEIISKAMFTKLWSSL